MTTEERAGLLEQALRPLYGHNCTACVEKRVERIQAALLAHGEQVREACAVISDEYLGAQANHISAEIRAKAEQAKGG